MQGAVLRFPTQGSRQQPAPPPPAAAPPLELLNPEKTRSLLGVADNIVQGARVLVEFLDNHRGVARAAGIEALTIELSGIIDGRRIEPVTDALNEAARLGQSADISADGFYYLTRAEKLLAQAHEDLARFTGSPPLPTQSFVPRGLGQASAPALAAAANDNTVTLVALAIVAIAVIALALK